MTASDPVSREGKKKPKKHMKHMKAQQDTDCQVKLDQASKYELAFVGWSWSPDDGVKYFRWISAGVEEKNKQTHT